jgi:hypothetical protein
MSIAVVHTHADGAPYSAIAMCPPHLVLKWAREVLITVPHARTLVIYDLPVIATRHVRMALWKWSFDKVQPVGKGQKTSLYEMRAMGREGWRNLCPGPAYFIVSRERAKSAITGSTPTAWVNVGQTRVPSSIRIPGRRLRHQSADTLPALILLL